MLGSFRDLHVLLNTCQRFKPFIVGHGRSLNEK